MPMLCRTAGAACPLPLQEGTDMNPFAKTVAGIFLVVGPQTNNPLEAEGICSALIQKLSDDRSRNLEPSTWQNAVQMVPSQVESATTSQTLDRTMPIGDLPGALASICANVVGGSHASALAQPIGSYLSKFGEPAAFNCLILDQTRTSQIHLYLTCLNVTDGPSSGSFRIASTLLSTTLDLSNKQTRTNVTKVFGSFGPPSDEPFYLRFFT
ncbi:glutamate acetyltransferase [Sinorhizobium medicae]|nr:glutamate acetyltransferase [Sinorhizobium medicae]MDX0921354.1 glutamate acetyltransferase [Sinorhizobium medicae]MDX0935227.1 glutamate acetyltransferase [Sinorhizobium medicae]MDX0941574.1 glutamate acetyltransferase [Sinorhizobium medicae]MDX1027662.1 glutamate acetyltransferase [Sinorhizobium medicae]